MSLLDLFKPALKCRSGEPDHAGVVYLRACATCGAVYVGETSRHLSERTAEHDSAIRNPHNNHSNALALHVFKTGHHISGDVVTLVTGIRETFARKFIEAICARAVDSSKLLNNQADLEVHESRMIKEVSDVWLVYAMNPAVWNILEQGFQKLNMKKEIKPSRSGTQVVRCLATRFTSWFVSGSATSSDEGPKGPKGAKSTIVDRRLKKHYRTSQFLRRF